MRSSNHALSFQLTIVLDSPSWLPRYGTKCIYTLRDISEDDRLRCVVCLLSEIKEWRRDFPPTLVQPRNPLFRRQAALLELGCYHASILLTRPFITHPYPHQGQKTAAVDAFLKICCETVKLTLKSTADISQLDADPRMFKALWYVHQVSFCCISTVHLLPRIREYQKRYSDQALSTFDSVDAELRQLADRATKALAEDTGVICPRPLWDSTNLYMLPKMTIQDIDGPSLPDLRRRRPGTLAEMFVMSPKSSWPVPPTRR